MSEGTTPLPLDRAPRRIEQMFDAIAGRYDVLNRVLSAGLDRGWRRAAVRTLDLVPGSVLLDVCTGTADLALTALAACPQTRVVGVDFAAAMLERGRDKIRDAGLSTRAHLSRGDAVHLPVGDETVDAVTIGFGIRNVADPGAALEEVGRVLRSGGRLAILEFGHPRPPILRGLYLWYFRRVLPLVGRLVSRHDSAYRYLPASVGTFYEPRAFGQLLTEKGFTGVQAVPLALGIVYLYTAIRPPAPPPVADGPGVTGRGRL